MKAIVRALDRSRVLGIDSASAISSALANQKKSAGRGNTTRQNIVSKADYDELDLNGFPDKYPLSVYKLSPPT